MTEWTMRTNWGEMRLYTLNTVVVGTGAAGYNAADRLYGYGQQDVVLVTEDVNAGTSRNTGSDKQTYYKLTLSGGNADSVREMAGTLYGGQCVDGDVALCEAALSAQGFLRLVDLGVPFPKNRYGEYIGYKTDHDPRRRATSVGPYTSKKMTECLETSVKTKGIRVFDGLQAVRVLSDGRRVLGLLCLEPATGEYVVFNCTNVVFATGGPAGMYKNSVYPVSHYGATGLAFESGAAGVNLTEWQYGLGSVAPRWNVSGTYMQVLPRFVSTDADGGDEREFLFDFFAAEEADGEVLTKVFLKGYQWPFDVRKVSGGSSIIDILVYLESGKGRRVFLDFRKNPLDRAVNFAVLGDEAREYLEKAGACFGTPIERLLRMNAPAVDFYLDKGVDLKNEMLEIALCAQHNNGGLGIDCWWQTNLDGFFAVGEAAGTHGVYRPGGSALNAGQVGGVRCAQYIAAKRATVPIAQAVFEESVAAQVDSLCALARRLRGGTGGNVETAFETAGTRMSLVGAAVRNGVGIDKTLAEIEKELVTFDTLVRAENSNELARALRLRETLICQYVYLCAMADYIKTGGKSRGSALYTDETGQKSHPSLPDMFMFVPDDGRRGGQVQEVLYRDGRCCITWRPVRPMPQDDDFFENVWRDFRESGNVY